ncbi:hypothetical protein V5G28_016055 [Scytonema sp. PRP1]
MKEILEDIHSGSSLSNIAAKFHNTLVEMIIAVAKCVGEEKIVLSGGCFQNKYLTERTIQRLRAENFCPYWHQRIPPMMVASFWDKSWQFYGKLGFKKIDIW